MNPAVLTAYNETVENGYKKWSPLITSLKRGVNDESSYDPVIAEATRRLPASQITSTQQPWPPRNTAL